MRIRTLPYLLALVLVSSACAAASPGSAEPPPAKNTPTTAATTTTTTAEPSSTLAERTTTTEPTTTTTTVLSTASLSDAETLAARSDTPLEVFESPLESEPILTLSETTDLGTPRVVSVLEGPVDGWLRVALPVRPNGSEGWIRSEDVDLFKLDRRVEVDLGDRTLRVVSGNDVLLETPVAVGSSASPTPTGSFFVTDSVILSNPGGPWGPHAFGLSAYSDHITEFNGGNGIIGIHGTNRPSSIGGAESLGCVRVPNEVALELAGMISAGVQVSIDA